MGQKPLSDDQLREVVRLVEEHGGVVKAAAAVGMNRATFQGRYDRARVKGFAPEKKEPETLQPIIPDGQKLRGVSTLVSKDGEVVLQWVKTREDMERMLQIIRETVEDLNDQIPREKPRTFEGAAVDDLLSMYVLTDYHLGMMASAAESGEDWNMDKAVRFLVAWFSHAIATAPAANTAIFCQLGDFLHFDGLDPVTPTSRHILDASGRFSEMVKAGVKALIIVIGMLLEKHERVHILMAEGNHDIASSVWLRILFKTMFEHEPRVTVDDSDAPYYAYEWGKVALFFHHGHKQKVERASKVFAGRYRQLYGRAEYCYAHMGDKHHAASKEDSLMLTEQHPTLAPKDAYATRGGYMSNRGASVITYSKRFGEVSRITIRPEMVTG